MATTISPSLTPATAKPIDFATAPLAEVLPPAELARPDLLRHPDFFDENHDGKLSVAEVAHGLVRLQMPEMSAWFVAFATVAVRGPPTTGKLKLEIDIDNAMKSAQSGSSGIFQQDGSVDQKKLDDLITTLDPQNKNHVTMADFTAWGIKEAEARVPGNGLMDHAKRGLMEAEVKLAWSGVFKIIGHADADGTKFLTRDDLRSFYDGSLFYRLAGQAEAAKAP